MNLSGNKFGSCLDMIIAQETQDEGRKKKIPVGKREKKQRG